MKTINLFTVISFLFLFSFCQEAEVITPEETMPQDLAIEVGAKVLKTVVGQVLDENGTPVPNATVNLFASQTTTDEDGRFEFFEKEAYEKHLYVKVKKEGYLLGSRAIVPTDGVNMVLIKLLPANAVGSFEATAGGEVTFDDVKINFGSAFVTQSGATYSGKVIVKASYLDPLAEDIGEIMPGSLRAASEDGETYLKTFGMIGVELQDESGNEIKIAKGSNAQISMPIPAEMSADAPATIPLWHFDEDKGYWVEEGEAQKIDGQYVGDVEHFSFWNCDIRVPSVTSYGRLLSNDGVPLANFQVHLISGSAGERSGFTDSKGVFGGIMPANKALTMEVFKDGVKLKTATISPLAEGDQIGDIEVSVKMISVTGEAKNCDGSKFDGLVKSYYGYVSINDGKFVVKVFENKTIDISLISKQGEVKGAAITLKIGSEDVDLGIMRYCIANQGVWISDFKSVLTNGYYYGSEDENEREFFPIKNHRVYEDVEKGEFYYSGLVGDDSQEQSFFKINIPSGYEGHKAYSLNDNSEMTVELFTGTANASIRNRDLTIDLSSFSLFEGDESVVSVYGSFDLKDEEGEYQQKYIYMFFSFEL